MEKNNWMISDLHIHSRFSQACSRNITFENLVKWAKIKGINLLGTGDFSHPIWFKEIKEKLIPNGKGFYYLNYEGENFPFVITGEISLIYSQDGKGRRIHLVILIPSFEIAEKIHAYLDTKGRRDYDGRPIFKIPAWEFVREMKNISEDIEIIPAHIWTPWFSLFGSMSGFDSFEQAFKDQSEKVYAIETGMSSDPEMNWRIKDLENKSILSFSDSHSFWPFRLGREATIFHKTDSYKELIQQIRENDFIGTIETDPAYGKYHWDGHRTCNFSCEPKKSREMNKICPICNKPLTIGVEYRVEELTNSNSEHKLKKEYFTLLPLQEILSLYFRVGINSKKIWGVYNEFIDCFKNEFNILLYVSREEFVKNNFEKNLVELILKNREGKIKIKPGFDGEYGVAQLSESKKEDQMTL